MKVKLLYETGLSPAMPCSPKLINILPHDFHDQKL